MALLPDARPRLRCFVAKTYRAGTPGPVLVVGLAEALDYMQQGWTVIGPDPHDEVDLAAWQKRQPEVHDDCA
jgi:hypothetical protein